MLDFVNSLKSLVKEQVTIDNNVFKLHYKLSVAMLVLFSLLLTSKQYFGDPITCDVGQKREVVETFCWITGTFILEDTLKDETLPGFGNPYRPNAGDKKSPIIWQKYYQWVCLLFWLEALLFYIPRQLWKTWEGGRLRLLVEDLRGPLITPNWSTAARERLRDYLMCGKFTHDVYATQYVFCEFLNVVNVVAQILFNDWILTGQFSMYGLQIIMNSDVNAMTRVFPKRTKCLYEDIGPSGSKQQLDASCVLSLNILNEKLFLIIYFWFLTLAICGILCLIYRMLVIFLPVVRTYLLMAQTRSFPKRQIKVIVDHLSYGDFFLLYHIGKNINPLIYRDLIEDLYTCIVRHGRKGSTVYVENV